MENYPDLGAIDESLSFDYRKFLELRDHINALMEPYRKDGVIGSSSEASISYLPKSKDEDTLIRKFDMEKLKKVLQVSHFELADEDKVIKHEGIKCERCWNYFDDTLTDDEGHHVCHRCHEVISSMEKKEQE